MLCELSLRAPTTVFVRTDHDSGSAEDHTTRYVAQENIEPLTERPTEVMLEMAGRYFKRWDSEQGKFVSNMTEEFPDD